MNRFGKQPLLECAPWKIDAFLDAIAKGQPAYAAAGIAGISTGSIHYYLEKAKNDQNSPYGTFAKRFERARQLSLASYVEQIRKHADNPIRPDWRGYAWLAERLHKEQLYLNNDAPSPGSVVNQIFIATQAYDLPNSSVKTREIEASPVSGSESGEAP